jgi:hypothetical protein
MSEFTEPNVTIEVVGSGEDARTIAHVDNWILVAFTGRGDGRPRVSIADLAQHVGQAAFKLRQTARALRSENFNPLETYLPSRGGVGGYLIMRSPSCTSRRRRRSF